VAQQLRVLQSFWVMERRLADTPEWPLRNRSCVLDSHTQDLGRVDDSLETRLPYSPVCASKP